MPAARDKKRVWFDREKKEMQLSICGSSAMLQTAQYSQLQLTIRKFFNAVAAFNHYLYQKKIGEP
jgi:hypothetical protein